MKEKQQIIYLKETDSTNRRVKELAEQGVPEGIVVVAESQTAGRGRMGKSFFSPPGSGLYFSLLLRPEQAAADALRITAAAAVAVARAVESLLSLDLKIKWVNDLYYNGKKVCGILAEGKLSPQAELDYCVLGIGLNVYAPAEGFGELETIAGALLEQDPGQNFRQNLLEKILECFFELYQNLQDPDMMKEYQRRSFLQDKRVTVLRGNERLRAWVVGISDAGELLVKANDGRILAFSSGEIQLEDYR